MFEYFPVFMIAQQSFGVRRVSAALRSKSAADTAHSERRFASKKLPREPRSRMKPRCRV